MSRATTSNENITLVVNDLQNDFKGVDAQRAGNSRCLSSSPRDQKRTLRYQSIKYTKV